MKKVRDRVARGVVFKPKSKFWVNLGWSWNGNCWYILWPDGLFNGDLVYFIVIWYILGLHKEKSGNTGEGAFSSQSQRFLVP
jgi:hypothetical protein